MLVGIDEAGRGPVFGPMVVAGVRGLDQERFRELGVQDSKLLSPKRREDLEPKIRALADQVDTFSVAAEEIDRRLPASNLNKLEVEVFGRIAKRLAGSALYLDAADVDAARFGRQVHEQVGPESTYGQIVSEHKADSTFPIVSAASIVAKVCRDEEVRRIARPLETKLGMPLGSGYPADPITMAFLEAWRRRFGVYPPGTRRTWDTIRLMEERVTTRRLEEFLAPTPQPPSAPTS